MAFKTRLDEPQVPSTTAFTDTSNTFSQTQTNSAPIQMGSSSTPTVDGQIGYNGTNLLFRESGINKMISTGSSGAGGGLGSYYDLKVAHDFPSTNIIRTTAKALTLFKDTTDSITLRNINVPVDFTSQANSDFVFPQNDTFFWVYKYIIYNSTTTTVSAIYSQSPDAPTLPSGYDYYGLVFAFLGVSASDDPLLGLDTVNVRNGSTIFKNGNPTIAGLGQSTSPTTISLASHAPPNAQKILLEIQSVHQLSNQEFTVQTATNANTSSFQTLACGVNHYSDGTAGAIKLEVVELQNTQSVTYLWQLNAATGGNGISLKFLGFKFE